MAVGDYEAPADSNHGDRWESLTLAHRIPVALDALGGVCGGEEIDDLCDGDDPGCEFGAGSIKVSGRRIARRRLAR